MKINTVLKNVLVIIFLLITVFLLLNYCASHIDKTRKEKSERDSKLESGTCVFDKADLDNLKIENNGVYFNVITNISLLKTYYSEHLRKINLLDSLNQIRTALMDNSNFKFSTDGHLAKITSIDIDLSSPFKFHISNKKELSGEYELNEFEEQFPKSFACRENFLRTTKTEDFITRIDNKNKNSKFKFMLLYFNFTEQLYKIECYHDSLNIIN